jgi:hypothetical protein
MGEPKEVPMKLHMSLPAVNLDKTVEFYGLIFDESPVKVMRDYVKFDPSSVPLNISFHSVESLEGINFSRHLGIQVSGESRLEEIYRALKGAGYVVMERRQEVCCYARQDKFWAEDPTGFRWEFYVLLEDSEKKVDNNTSCCGEEDVESCC